MADRQAVVVNGPEMLGDHPALDFLNTVFLVDGQLVDSLQSDDDVLQWLARAGWPVHGDLSNLQSSSLLNTARALREVIRNLIEKRKTGKRADMRALNEFLAEARSYLKIMQKKNGIDLRREWKQRTPQEICAPLAESAAELLATGDFNLIRCCESDECVLWFYDRTKSHHRRWCSMATCGNRHKVAEFRRRKQDSL